MVENKLPIKQIAAKVEDLHTTAKDLLEISDEFPALNRNLKRILASVEMIRINVEDPQG